MERTRMRIKCAGVVAVLMMVGLAGCGTLPEPVPDAPRIAQVSAPADSAEALPASGGSPLLPVAGAAAALFVGVGGVLLVLWRDRRTTRPGPGEL
ncbi:hypothetical protein ACFVVL_23785 [Kitasatospora sp. NPDC058115]|uniref:hypothetical protein n=1 Tax=Kitasatospora sp. NPDC058115 TaxID=3346347 RepID=UPI0036DEA897